MNISKPFEKKSKQEIRMESIIFSESEKSFEKVNKKSSLIVGEGLVAQRDNKTHEADVKSNAENNSFNMVSSIDEKEESNMQTLDKETLDLHNKIKEMEREKKPTSRPNRVVSLTDSKDFKRA